MNPSIILPGYVAKTEKHTFVCPCCETAQDVEIDATQGVAVIECKDPECGQLIMAMRTRNHGWVYHAVFPLGGEVRLQ